MYSIKKYDASHYSQWNDFIEKSKNGTFLFHRDFMEYHSDRFEDFSLLAFDGNKLVAVFPANKAGEEVHSHQGLTYGGLILADSIGVNYIEHIFDAITAYLKNSQINTITIKQVISIYHKKPANEMNYLLFKKGATLCRRDMNLAINYSESLSVSKSKMKNFRKLALLGFEIKKDNDFELFWDSVLIPRLEEKYSARPVHTKKEIAMLHNRFPSNIVQYNIYYDGEILAGITLFDFGDVVKSQYGATTAKGEEMRALDYLFITLIFEYKEKRRYFDMGTVNENQGKTYNKGLLKQKEELGCSVYNHDYYSLVL
ncbi:FemAB family protein [Flavobacterium album]|uniref:FemAB family protein n=1 Tax=Flavobacterium album TaxID=2175091 RepID=A0A2S1R265_9FLAO|nr:FemAB family protein [Flavobacterium album]AWH86734.1 FemAB family protein [Flavobacterium album]